MGNAEPIPELDRKGLREFGLVTGAIVAGLFGLFFPWLLDTGYPLWPWLIFLALGGWALLAPGSLGPVYRTWMRFGLLIGKVTTPIIMGVVFYAVLVPTGLVRRLLGRDSLNRRFEPDVESYRIQSNKTEPQSLEKPF